MEWVGKKDEMRLVNVLFNSITKVVEVRDESTKLLRTINLSRGQPFDLWLSSNGLVAVLKLPKEYDLVNGNDLIIIGLILTTIGSGYQM